MTKERSKEGDARPIRPSIIQGANMEAANMVVNETAHGHRRVLSTINRSIIGANPSIVKKKRTSRKELTSTGNSEGVIDGTTTRKFAAQEVQPSPENTQQASILASSSGSVENATTIIVEKCEADRETAVPIFEKIAEENQEDIDEVEEIEMEDAEEEIMDIDAEDAENPLAVVEYVNDICAFYRETENLSCVSPSFLGHQVEINDKMRAMLIDWIIMVHLSFELREETLFLTVNLTDRYLEHRNVEKNKLQLVGMTALLLACKFAEVKIPLMNEIIQLSAKFYTRRDVIDMEMLILKTLNFKIHLPTPYSFVMRFLKAAKADKRLEFQSLYISELCLLEYEMVKFPPSLLAAAAIYTAQCTLDRFKHWSRTMEWYSKYSEENLLECAKMMVSLQVNAGSGKFTGVYSKYSASELGYAARAEPAHFLFGL